MLVLQFGLCKLLILFNTWVRTFFFLRRVLIKWTSCWEDSTRLKRNLIYTLSIILEPRSMSPMVLMDMVVWWQLLFWIVITNQVIWRTRDVRICFNGFDLLQNFKIKLVISSKNDLNVHLKLPIIWVKLTFSYLVSHKKFSWLEKI